MSSVFLFLWHYEGAGNNEIETSNEIEIMKSKLLSVAHAHIICVSVMSTFSSAKKGVGTLLVRR